MADHIVIHLAKDERFALRDQEGRDFINWVRNGALICDRPAYGAETKLARVTEDLLTALKNVVATFHDHPDRDESSLALAKAAIAKATGSEAANG